METRRGENIWTGSKIGQGEVEKRWHPCVVYKDKNNDTETTGVTMVIVRLDFCMGKSCYC